MSRPSQGVFLNVYKSEARQVPLLSLPINNPLSLKDCVDVRAGTLLLECLLGKCPEQDLNLHDLAVTSS